MMLNVFVCFANIQLKRILLNQSELEKPFLCDVALFFQIPVLVFLLVARSSLQWWLRIGMTRWFPSPIVRTSQLFNFKSWSPLQPEKLMRFFLDSVDRPWVSLNGSRINVCLTSISVSLDYLYNLAEVRVLIVNWPRRNLVVLDLGIEKCMFMFRWANKM